MPTGRRLTDEEREEARKRANAWYKNHPDRARANQYRVKFGITLDQFTEMKTAQRGLCAICEQPETATRGGKVRELCVDHCHKTGKVRGLLCKSCNIALGEMRDSATRFRAAAIYLDTHSE